MINVLNKFYSLISAIVTRTYHKGAEDKTVFPYATYSCPTINSIGNYTQGRDDVFLEIDIWDNNIDETTIETLTRAVDVALNGHSYSDGNIAIRLDKLTILDVPDPDETINRRQLRFRVITYQF